jgi:hypothetical protein
VFSNNGFLFFGSCLLADPGLATLVSAVILDSCPSYITPQVAATGLGSAVWRVEAGRAKEGWRNGLLSVFVSPLVRVLEARQRGAWEAWTHHFPPVAHLFLYSKADGVVEWREVAKFRREHGKRLALKGVRLDQHEWHQAQHCGLLRHDPATYTQQVATFLKTHLVKPSDL